MSSANEGPVMPDMRIQIIFYVHAVNMFFTMVCMTFGAIPYYHYFGFTVTRNVFIISLCVWTVLYVVLCVATYAERVKTALVTFVLWTTSSAMVVGFLAALSYNISPVQFMALSWTQSVVLVVYSRLSPRNMSLNVATALMAMFTIVVWCLFIYAFVVERDWLAAGIILALALVLVGYNRWRLETTEGRYDASFSQGVLAALHLYVGYAVDLANHESKN